MNLEARLDDIRAEYLRRLAPSDSTLLSLIERHITARMGKMLRPRMLLAAADTLGQGDTERTTLLAVAVEMLHNASLLHDDVIDNDQTRRGLPSVNSRFGNTAAVLAGDYLLAQVMSILHEVNDSDASRRINRTVTQMVEAELLQLQAGSNYPLTTYLKIIDGKTASLFATACALGNPEYEGFGLHYGRLFQLRDDIADHEGTPLTTTLIEQEKEALAAIKHTLQVQILDNNHLK